MPGGGAPPPGPAMPPRRWETAEPQHRPQVPAAPREVDSESCCSRGGGGGGVGHSTAAAVAAAAASSLPSSVRSALELAEARRRLLEAESRRQLVSELESRVHHLHRVFLEAELRLAHRAETVGRLGSGVGQAELHLAAHGQRLKKTTTLRRSRKLRPPALLASALALSGCVPWGGGQARRGGGRAGARPESPESPFRRSSAPGPAAASSPAQRP